MLFNGAISIFKNPLQKLKLIALLSKSDLLFAKLIDDKIDGDSYPPF
jgi:hypothetical protein